MSKFRQKIRKLIDEKWEERREKVRKSAEVCARANEKWRKGLTTKKYDFYPEKRGKGPGTD